MTLPVTQTVDVIWWITAVEIPVVASLFWLHWRMRAELLSRTETQRTRHETDITDLRDALAAFKLDVARNYVSIPYLKDVEKRLTGHLLRIEAKLDMPVPPSKKDLSL
ncbi:hypothetical protein [Thalassospira sp. ER-Se-21-Dark]|uniref:hypothetical protein n=1 Tax=Thalassospira sp. ER-Se-21-Dark TaxID=2585190 RepID=UPI001DE9154C|nr:hypothetical protein [Thalassospira sp. ER-Se-21-Dark]MBP3127768.1 hypothetical protein [Thalassospira sp. ER-Se-21-Dark]